MMHREGEKTGLLSRPVTITGAVVTLVVLLIIGLLVRGHHDGGGGGKKRLVVVADADGRNPTAPRIGSLYLDEKSSLWRLDFVAWPKDAKTGKVCQTTMIVFWPEKGGEKIWYYANDPSTDGRKTFITKSKQPGIEWSGVVTSAGNGYLLTVSAP